MKEFRNVHLWHVPTQSQMTVHVTWLDFFSPKKKAVILALFQHTFPTTIHFNGHMQFYYYELATTKNQNVKIFTQILVYDAFFYPFFIVLN